MRLRMRPRGFNYHRLRSVDSMSPDSKRNLATSPARRIVPSPLEWLVSCSVGAATAAAYFLWTGEFDMILDWLNSR